MTSQIKIGKGNYSIYVEEKGCEVRVLRNNQHFSMGRYYPHGFLFLTDCSVEDIRSRLETEIKNNIDEKKIVFPYCPAPL